MDITGFIDSLPPGLVYLTTGLVIGVESLGIPLPGEIVLVGASLLAARAAVDPWAVAAAAATGAIIGDSIGYSIGRRGGPQMLVRLERRFPRHFGENEIERARDVFRRRGAWAVFFGRFVALLRILAGPIAGTLRMPYRKFLLANVSGAILWAGVTTAVVYAFGLAAEKWLQRTSWAALALVVIVGVVLLALGARRRSSGAEAATDRTDPHD